jgi:hypothetical protein
VPRAKRDDSGKREVMRLLNTAFVVGFAFADRAVSADTEEKQACNVRKAAAAYDAILNFMDRASLTEVESSAFSDKVGELKRKLDQLEQKSHLELKKPSSSVLSAIGG